MRGQLHRGKGRIVAADRDQLVHAETFEGTRGQFEVVWVFGRVRARDAEGRATGKVDPADVLDREWHHVRGVTLHEPAETVAHTNHLHATQCGANAGCTDNTVDPRCRTTAAQNRQALLIVHPWNGTVRRPPQRVSQDRPASLI